ncbi:glycine and tyrosine-rich protein-like [Aedes aegypti]|uniref:Uncharacterized protein n=1 Tax=Aedes aegypti TaxID=7159 RepID=A0A6I8U758_AEDAE|nr:glycine and tyrosine-rich protein-like [Aedes aegypti]
MIKIVCLFAVLAVALADVRPVPSSDVPIKSDAPVSNEMLGQDVATDMDKAETFGFGYHKHVYVVPQYYGGYYGGYHGGYGGYHGGYYPYYAHQYGYPYYY